MPTDQASLLSLLYLSSPALPIGTFAYSQGLEKAIELDWVADAGSLKAWCDDCMKLGLVELDIPLMSALRAAIIAQDEQACAELNAQVYAYRESYELYEEERHLGSSLHRLLVTQKLDSELGDMKFRLPQQPSYLCSFAAMSIALEMSDELAQLSFVWSWLENQVSVASKAIPIGQSDAQSVLLALRKRIPAYLERASEIRSSEAARGLLYGSLPGQALCSALHESQYSRLFRS